MLHWLDSAFVFLMLFVYVFSLTDSGFFLEQSTLFELITVILSLVSPWENLFIKAACLFQRRLILGEVCSILWAVNGVGLALAFIRAALPLGFWFGSVNRFNFLYVTNKCCQEIESWNAVTHPRGWRLTVQIVFFSPYFRRSVSDNCGRLALVRDVTHTRRVRKLIRVMKSLRPFFSPRSVFCFSWRLVTWILHRGEKPGQIQKITMIIK